MPSRREPSVAAGCRIAVLTNPTAGKGRGAQVRDVAVAALRAGGCKVQTIEGRDADEAAQLADAAVAERVDALVACGGDGLVNIALQAVAGTDVCLGMIPAGTGNDTARSVGIPLNDVGAAAGRILEWRPRPMDLARIGDRYFSTVLAAGFDAVVNERANQLTWPHGQMRYNLATLAELPRFKPRHYTLDLDGVVRRTPAMLVAVGNGPSFGGGLRITHGAWIDDGLLDVVIIKPIGKLELLRTYPKLFTGEHTQHAQYERHRVRRVTVAAEGIVGYADGERFGPLPLTVESVPAAVRVLT